jgi:hypothetical protein
MLPAPSTSFTDVAFEAHRGTVTVGFEFSRDGESYRSGLRFEKGGPVRIRNGRTWANPERPAVAMTNSEAMNKLRGQYRELAVTWDEARDDPQEANRIFDLLQVLSKELRASAEGRQAVSGLLDDPVTAVRLAAATHSLQWDPERAQVALEDIERGGNLHAVTAKWTLRSYRSGKLNLNW